MFAILSVFWLFPLDFAETFWIQPFGNRYEVVNSCNLTGPSTGLHTSLWCSGYDSINLIFRQRTVCETLVRFQLLQSADDTMELPVNELLRGRDQPACRSVAAWRGSG